MDQETNKCRKNFPRPYVEESRLINNVPHYKRPNNGRIISVC